MKSSPIFSLADPLDLKVPVNEFVELGEAFDGEHTVLLFKPLAGLVVRVAHEEPEVLNRFCTLYNIVNNRGTLYGHLFVTASGVVRIQDKRMTVKCGEESDTTFEQLHLGDKSKLLTFRNSHGSLVFLIAAESSNPYVVEDL